MCARRKRQTESEGAVIGDIGIKGRHPHGHSRDDFDRRFALTEGRLMTDARRATQPRPRTTKPDGLANRESGLHIREEDGPRRQAHVRAAPLQSWAEWNVLAPIDGRQVVR